MKEILALATMLALFVLSPVRAADAAPLVFSLNTVDVSKVVVLMYKGPKTTTLCEVTFSKDKQAELAKLATQSGGKAIQIVVNGKPVAETTFTPGKTGHSIKFPCASPEEAFAEAKVLLAPTP
jgi:hypothetical protein